MLRLWLTSRWRVVVQVALGKVLAVIKESSAEHWEALKQGLAHKYPKLNKV